MVFYTCVSKHYRDLIPLYEFCVNRVYPDTKVVIDKEPHNPSCKRFLNEVEGDYVHITDADILILPHEKTHKEYYGSRAINGATYLRGATESGGDTWRGDRARIAAGHIGFTPEAYERTRAARTEYAGGAIEDYREFDEIMLARILRRSGYPIPKSAYTFYTEEKWDWEYRDLHLNDFASMKFLKWSPNIEKVKDLVTDPYFRKITRSIDSYWRTLLHKVELYATKRPLSC